MNWAADIGENPPSLDQLAVNKSTVLDDSNFKELVALYNLTVIQEEDQYYILDGAKEDLKLFSSDWSLGL